MIKSEQKNIKVVVRVRPYNRRELEQNQRTIIKVMDSTTLLFDPDEDDDEFFYQGTKQHYRDVTKKVNKKLSMGFDRIFDVDAVNHEIFEECTSPLVDSVMDGYNCSVFVYGATGAGKTFTMLGSENCRGITYLTMQDLFTKIDSLSGTRKFDIGVSYLEVYNEQVKNLLTTSCPLKLREDSNGVVVSGLVLKPIYNADELLELLALGNNNRTQHPTDANAESSRSHAVFQVHIRMTDKKTNQKRTVKLSMIDLAGSERAASTKGIGVRFKEGASINKSLLALGNCINKLADGSKHIPYRDSNLTRILKDSLGGNCQTLMIANVSQSSLTYEDTYNTLKYASRAKKIRTTLHKNVMKSNMPKDFYVKKVNELMEELDKMKETNNGLEAKLANNRQFSKAYDETELQCWHRKIDAVYSALIKTQEYYFGLISKEKLLKFRTKLKKNCETNKNILKLDSSKLKDELFRLQASISRFDNQIEKQRNDVGRWLNKYEEALSDLRKLKKEIQDAKSYQALNIYIKSKDEEVRTSKANIKLNHMSKINSMYHIELEHLLKEFQLSLDIIQRNYLTLRADNSLASDMIDKINQLSSMINGYGIRFKNSQTDEKDNEGNLELSLESNNENDLQSETIVIGVNNKRRLSDDTNKIEVKNKISKNLFNSNNIGCESSKSSHQFKHPGFLLNTTIDLQDPSDSNLTLNFSNSVQNDLVKGILSDSNCETKNRSHIKSVLLKSKINRENILKSVAVGIQKDIKKKSPHRIGKNPRGQRLPMRATASSSNTLKRHENPDHISDPGFVRINRAASLRVKK